MGAPKHHSVSDSFNLDLIFNGTPSGIAPKNNQPGSTITVTNGAVTKTQQTDDNDPTAWKVTVSPNGTEDVTVTVPTGSCDDDANICVNNEPLNTPLSSTVLGPITASFTNVPTNHDGSDSFDLHLDFDHAPAAGFSYVTIEDHLLDLSGATIDRVWRRTSGNDQLWGIQIRPASTDDIAATVNATANCSQDHAVCDSSGRMLASTQITIPGPPLINIGNAATAEGANATLNFPVTLSRASASAVTVSYATSDGTGTATAGDDYTATSGTLTFAANETSKTVSVTVLQDTVDEAAETLTLTLSNAGGAVIVDGTATGTISNTPHTDDAPAQPEPEPSQEPQPTGDPPSAPAQDTAPVPLTATYSNVPAAHDGSAGFTFHLEFSETPEADFSYKTLHQHAFTVPNGTVSKARRLEPPGNVRWEITVTPAGDATVTVTLPSTTSCDDQGAICTDDGRRFTGPLTLTVDGPGS